MQCKQVDAGAGGALTGATLLLQLLETHMGLAQLGCLWMLLLMPLHSS